VRHAARVKQAVLIGSSLPMPVAPVLLDAARDNEPKAAAMINEWSYSASGQIGYLQEWEIKGSLAKTITRSGAEYAGPVTLRHVGLCSVNGVEEKAGVVELKVSAARLEAIIAQSTKSKEMSHPLRALMPQVSNLSMLGAPIVTQILALLYSRSNLSDVLPPAANITVSNVPGPRQTLYAAGAELLHIFPVSISTHGIALNITVQSYRDQLDFGFIAGANIIPHVQVLCDMLPLEFEALEAAYAPPPNITSAAE
jgi:hypothetical protein